MNINIINRKKLLIFFILILICVIFYFSKFNYYKLPERNPFVGIGYNLEYKGKIFPNMTDSEIDEVINKITIAAGKRAKDGKRFKVNEEELKELGITGLNPDYLHMIKISTE